jgi:hypothetical protein
LKCLLVGISHQTNIGTACGQANCAVMMRRTFARHTGGWFLLVIAGCGIRLVQVEDFGYMHVGPALRMRNSGRNCAAEQDGQYQQY